MAFVPWRRRLNPVCQEAVVRWIETSDAMEKNVREEYARDLHGQLTRELASQLPGATASVSGGGCHWNCRAEREERSCTVHCFEAPPDVPGPEFLVCFEAKAVRTIAGRTWEQGEVVAAACAWLGGQSAQALYSQFGFVERQRRAGEGSTSNHGIAACVGSQYDAGNGVVWLERRLHVVVSRRRPLVRNRRLPCGRHIPLGRMFAVRNPDREPGHSCHDVEALAVRQGDAVVGST